MHHTHTHTHMGITRGGRAMRPLSAAEAAPPAAPPGAALRGTTPMLSFTSAESVSVWTPRVVTESRRAWCRYTIASAKKPWSYLSLSCMSPRMEIHLRSDMCVEGAVTQRGVAELLEEREDVIDSRLVLQLPGAHEQLGDDERRAAVHQQERR